MDGQRTANNDVQLKIFAQVSYKVWITNRQCYCQSIIWNCFAIWNKLTDGKSYAVGCNDKLDMCLWNMDAPGGTKSKYGKISTSYILTPPYPQGHEMSLKCEQPLDELTVQVWLLYNYPNFKYWTLFVSGTELQTNGQTIQTLHAPGGPFRPGA